MCVLCVRSDALCKVCEKKLYFLLGVCSVFLARDGIVFEERVCRRKASGCVI